MSDAQADLQVREAIAENSVLDALGPIRTWRLSSALERGGFSDGFDVPAHTLVLSNSETLRRLASCVEQELAREIDAQVLSRQISLTGLSFLINAGLDPKGTLEATRVSVSAIDPEALDALPAAWQAVADEHGPQLVRDGFHEVHVQLLRMAMVARTTSQVAAETVVNAGAAAPARVLILSGEAAAAQVEGLPLIDITPASLRGAAPRPALAILGADSAVYVRWRAVYDDASSRWSDARLIRGQLLGMELAELERGRELLSAVTENDSRVWVIPVDLLADAAGPRGRRRADRRQSDLFQAVRLEFASTLSACLQQITIDQRAALVDRFQELVFTRAETLYGLDERPPGLYLVGRGGGVTVTREWPGGEAGERLRAADYGDEPLPVVERFEAQLQYGDLFGVGVLEYADDKLILEGAEVSAGTVLYFLPERELSRLLRSGVSQVEAMFNSLVGLNQQLPILVAVLQQEPILNDQAPGDLAVALGSGQFIQWRVGGAIPSPLGHAQGLSVVLGGELLGMSRERRGDAWTTGEITGHVQVYPHGAVLGAAGLGLDAHLDEDRVARLPAWLIFLRRSLLVGIFGDHFERRSIELLETFVAQLNRNREYMDCRAGWLETTPAAMPEVVLVGAPRSTRERRDVHGLLIRLCETLEREYGERSAVVAIGPDAHADGRLSVEASEQLMTLLLRIATSVNYLKTRGITNELMSMVATLAEEPENRRSWVQERDALRHVLRRAVQESGEGGVQRIFLLVEQDSPAAPLLMQSLASIADRVVTISDEPSAPREFILPTQTPFVYTALRPHRGSRGRPCLEVKRGQRYPPSTVRVGLLASGEPDEQSLQRWARAVSDRRVGIALGGGGAWGMAHVAVLRAIHQSGVPIDMISGSSVGCSVGAFYCAMGLDGLDLFMKERARLQVGFMAGMVTSTLFAAMLRRLIGDICLEEMTIPFFPVTSDLSTASERSVLTGDVAVATRMSGSLAPLYPATPTEDAILVDGGITRNLPVSVLELEGSRLIAASNIVPAPAYEAPRRPAKPGSLGMVLHDLNPGHRLSAAAKSALTLFYAAGNSTAEGAAVTFESQWTGVMPMDLVQGPKLIRDIQSTPTFWQSVHSLQERWALLKEPQP